VLGGAMIISAVSFITWREARAKRSGRGAAAVVEKP